MHMIATQIPASAIAFAAPSALFCGFHPHTLTGTNWNSPGGVSTNVNNSNKEPTMAPLNNPILPAPDFRIIPSGPRAGKEYRAEGRVLRRLRLIAKGITLYSRTPDPTRSTLDEAAKLIAQGWIHFHYAKEAFENPALFASGLGIRYGESGKCPVGAFELPLPPRYTPVDCKHLLRASGGNAVSLLCLIATLAYRESCRETKFCGVHLEHVHEEIGHLNFFEDVGRQKLALDRAR